MKPTNPPFTDQPITDDLRNQSSNHRPTDPIIMNPTNTILFQRPDNLRIFILQKTNTAEKTVEHGCRTTLLSNIY